MDTDRTSFESTETGTPTGPRPLVRPVAGRSVAGVAAGLAHYLNMPVGLVRFGFLFAIVFGGLGFVLYGAGWLLVRDETETESIAQRVFENLGEGPSWLGIALLVLGAVIVLDNITFMPGSLIWAIVLIAVGLLLYRGDIGPRQASDAGPYDVETGASTGPAVPEERSASGGGTDTPAPPPGSPAGPPPPPEPPPSPPPPPSILGRLTVGAGLLALGIMAIVDNATTLIDPQARHYLALATVVLGLGLLTGAFVGRARWMILLGIFLLPALAVSPVTEVEWEGDFERVVAPGGLDELQSSYRASAGVYQFDLTESDWDGQNLSLDVELATGKIVIALPPNVGLRGSAQVGIGAIEAPDGNRGGLGDISRTFSLSGEQGSLEVDLDVGAGVIQIYRDGQLSSRAGSSDVHLGPGNASVTERNQ